MSEALSPDIYASNSSIKVDDSTLVELSKHRDSAALEKLILRYQNRIYNVILKICANPDDAAELTQQTFVKIIENLKDFKQRSGFYTWAFRIAVNLTLSYCKRKGKIGLYSLDEQAQANNPGAGKALIQFLEDEASPDPAAVAQNKELCELVVRQLSKLTDEHRIVLILRDVEGMEYNQIARILGVELGTVKSRISRARGALKQILEGFLK
jgi:RNA polymerase sigma-70 factor (ECF subfamily)